MHAGSQTKGRKDTQKFVLEVSEQQVYTWQVLRVPSGEVRQGQKLDRDLEALPFIRQTRQGESQRRTLRRSSWCCRRKTHGEGGWVKGSNTKKMSSEKTENRLWHLAV